jgi:hypothetical protein
MAKVVVDRENGLIEVMRLVCDQCLGIVVNPQGTAFR